ncbi:MAG: ABC-type transport auxiliary lipoprotein family protein [Pseudomonadota bacterium]
MPLRKALFAAILTLSACASDPLQSVAVESTPAPDRVGIRYTDVFVREVSLPTYAASETIFIAAANGLLTEQPTSVWADDPTRAITLGLAASLQEISRARVAPEPWPFGANPEVAVDVRFETLAPGADGTYRASGQVFVAPDEVDATNRALTFRMSETYDLAGGQPAIARARATLVSRLAADIARRGLR